MAKITLIDDDYSTEILVERLRYAGHNADRIKSAIAALDSIDEVASSDLVILDLIMERPQPKDDPRITGDLATGMQIFNALRQRSPHLRIIVFSATTDQHLIQSIKQFARTTFIPKWESPSLTELLTIIESNVGAVGQLDSRRAFIVHGHDNAEKYALKNYLQNTIQLPEPIILHEMPNLGRTVIEKLETYALEADLVFVLLTPDDRMAAQGDSNDEKRRARQNVIFELGYFLGIFGRRSGRVFLLHKGVLDLPSDLAGVIYIDISDGIEAAGEIIRREVNNVFR